MSWAAHDLEPYLLRAKIGASISVPFCLLGSYSPDLLTKWAVYGLDFSGDKKLVDDPVQLHRGFPGLGFTHSLLFPLVIAGLIFLASRNRQWAWSFAIGGFAGVLSDSLDSVGVMLFFPLTDWHLHFDMWQYVGQAGRSDDAVAYYTSLGGLWDIFWAAWLATRWRILTTAYFVKEIYPTDKFWPWIHGKLGMIGALTVYRSSAFFGLVSIVSWIIWAIFVNDFHPSFDWTWGGPQWAPKVGPP